LALVPPSSNFTLGVPILSHPSSSLPFPPSVSLPHSSPYLIVFVLPFFIALVVDNSFLHVLLRLLDVEQGILEGTVYFFV
jgi:hypothetical protein